MSMTTVSNLNGDGGRTFAIEVIGSPHQARLRTSAYTVRVPYSSLAKTIHSIGQRGGKVVDVKMLTTQLNDLVAIPVAAGVFVPLDQKIAPQPPTKATSNPEPDSRRQQPKSKKR
jgi:CpcD/allophycocyanin linker domain